MSALAVDYRLERPALRVTRRGRLVITSAMFAALAFAGVVGASSAVAGHEVRPVPVRDVVVQPGDTLWAIAATGAQPGEDVRELVAEIVELNALESSAVYTGQQLVVPVAD
jgi:hypothetical protein